MPTRAGESGCFSLWRALGLYSLAFLLLAFPWLRGSASIPYDAKSQFYPQLVFLARSLASGQSPFWTPNVFAGWPQIADPQSLIFSPLYLIIALFNTAPSPWLADMMVFLLLYVGGFGIILLFRDHGWHMAGALVAALAFAFGGSAASRIQHVGQIESLMFLPLTLLMLLRMLERSSWLAGAFAGLFAAMIVLGRNQVTLLGLYVLFGAVLWHWWGKGFRQRIAASIKPLTVGAIAGIAIVIIPVTLTALLAAASNRPNLGVDFAGPGSLHPANLLMLVFPDLFGASDFHREFWGPPGFPWHEAFGQTGLFVAQNIGQIYCGALIAVVVGGPGLVRRLLWAPDIRFYTVAGTLSLIYALGWYLPPALAAFELLPGVSLFRRPADATFVLCAMLSIIGGYLVHRVLTDAVLVQRRWRHFTEVLIALTLITTAVGLAIRVGTLDIAGLPILWGIGFAAGAIAALALARRLAPRSAVAAAAILVAFSVFDLAFNNAPNESTGLPPANYEALAPDTADETVTLLKSRLMVEATPDRRDRVELVGVAYHWPNIGLIHDFDHLFGHNPLRLADFVRATAAPDTVAGPDQRTFTPLLPSYRSVLEDLLGVRFIATGVPIERIDPSLKPGDLTLIARTKNAFIYENPHALPRVLLANDWRKVDFNDLIAKGGWPEVDPRHVVLLEHAPPGFSTVVLGGTARIVRYHNTEIDILTDATFGGILVLNDIWHPWWRATIDDVPATILKANVLFRAVAVPAGRHTVRFTFHPLAGAWTEIRQKITSRWQ